MIDISRDDLVRHNVCQRGLDMFDAIATMHGCASRIQIEWTPLHAVWLASADPGAAGWLQRGGLIPDADLSGMRLSRSSLSLAYLLRANLQKADLRGANLSRAMLVQADLRGADLRRADVRGANLSGANLDGADIREADLSGSYVGKVDAPVGWVVDDRGRLMRVAARASR
jgi:uncharacterized protein YjbI with pentapeptide repeats